MPQQRVTWHELSDEARLFARVLFEQDVTRPSGGAVMAEQQKTQQVPSVGRMVSYRAYGTPGGEFPAGVVRAAVITEVDDPGNPDSTVGLCVMNPTGLFFNRGLKRGQEPGCWDWPAYVPPVPVQAPPAEA